jgi:hypothetical protein
MNTGGINMSADKEEGVREVEEAGSQAEEEVNEGSQQAERKEQERSSYSSSDDEGERKEEEEEEEEMVLSEDEKEEKEKPASRPVQREVLDDDDEKEGKEEKKGLDEGKRHAKIVSDDEEEEKEKPASRPVQREVSDDDDEKEGKEEKKGLGEGKREAKIVSDEEEEEEEEEMVLSEDEDEEEEKPASRPIQREVSDDDDEKEGKEERKGPGEGKEEAKSKFPMRSTLGLAQKGVAYQLHYAMLLAFEYAFKKDGPFRISIENLDYGDFDDVVIAAGKEVRAFQFKHHDKSDEEAAPVSQLLTKGGSGKGLMLHKYFSSLFEKFHKFSSAQAGTTFELFTNGDLLSGLTEFLGKDKSSFSENFWNRPNLRAVFFVHTIIASIEKYSAKSGLKLYEMNKPEKKKVIRQLAEFLLENNEFFVKAFKGKLFEFVKSVNDKYDRSPYKRDSAIKHFLDTLIKDGWPVEKKGLFEGFIKILQSNYPTFPKDSGINFYAIACAKHSVNKEAVFNFLKMLRFNFGQNNLEKAKERIKKDIRKEFPVFSDDIYNAYCIYFYEELMSLKGEYLGREKIKALFGKWFSDSVCMPQLRGFTAKNMEEAKQSLGGKKYIKQEKNFSKIYQFISSSDCVLFLQGAPGAGKSEFIRSYISKYPGGEGRCLFLRMDQIFALPRVGKNKDGLSMQLSYMDSINVIFIDNINIIGKNADLEKTFLSLIMQLKAYKKKIVLLGLSPGSDSIEKLIRGRISGSGAIGLSVEEFNRLNLDKVFESYPNIEEYYNQVFLTPEDRKPIDGFLRSPKFLNLVLQAGFGRADEAGHGAEKFQTFMLRLVVKGGNLAPDLGRLRMRILSTIAQGGSVPKDEKSQSVLNNLVGNGILKKEGGVISFNRPMYEKFAVERIASAVLKHGLRRREVELRAPEKIGPIVREVCRVLNGKFFSVESKKIFTDFLRSSSFLKKLLEKNFKGLIDPENDNFLNLLRIAKASGDKESQAFFAKAKPRLKINFLKRGLMKKKAERGEKEEKEAVRTDRGRPNAGAKEAKSHTETGLRISKGLGLGIGLAPKKDEYKRGESVRGGGGNKEDKDAGRGSERGGASEGKRDRQWKKKEEREEKERKNEKEGGGSSDRDEADVDDREEEENPGIGLGLGEGTRSGGHSGILSGLGAKPNPNKRTGDAAELVEEEQQDPNHSPLKKARVINASDPVKKDSNLAGTQSEDDDDEQEDVHSSPSFQNG